MNCSEVREYLFAFLDSELDAPLSIELQRHLDRCPECAREAEIERTVARSLNTSLCVGAEEVVDPDESVRRVVDSVEIDRKESRSRIAGRSPLQYAAAAVILVLLVSTSWFVLPRGSSSHAAERFADQVVTDLEHFLETGRPLQIASADPVEVSLWLLEETAIRVSLPSGGSCASALQGGRKCKLNGRPAAFAIYDMDGTAASLVVIAETDRILDGMTHVRQAGRSHWIERCKGHTVVACKRGALVYAAVSTLPEEDLLCLMTGSTHEGD